MSSQAIFKEWDLAPTAIKLIIRRLGGWQSLIADVQGNKGAHVTLIQLRLLLAEVTHLQGRTEAARAELDVLIKQFRQANETSYISLAEAALARIAESEAVGHS